jgi:hypothetical protein
MPSACCRHCQTTIVDYTPVAEADGDIFCCSNCLLASQVADRPLVAEAPACAHCASDIVDSTTVVERVGRRFCCYNCAAADGLEAAAVRVLAA